MVDTSGLWDVYHKLDGGIWGFKYDLVEIPDLDEYLRKTLELLKIEIKKIEGGN